MNKDIKIFNSSDFGQIKIAKINGKPYFVGKDIAKSLGYKNHRDAISRHCKGVVKNDDFKEGGHCIALITEGDMYRLITNSELPQAEKFEEWVFDEVLPQIRKTGSYSNGNFKPTVDNSLKEKEIEARLKNARAREANILLKICNNPNLSKEYVQVLQSKASEIITGQAILPLPVVERKTYSATEIGNKLGISTNKK